MGWWYQSYETVPGAGAFRSDRQLWLSVFSGNHSKSARNQRCFRSSPSNLKVLRAVSAGGHYLSCIRRLALWQERLTARSYVASECDQPAECNGRAVPPLSLPLPLSYLALEVWSQIRAELHIPPIRCWLLIPAWFSLVPLSRDHMEPFPSSEWYFPTV